MKHPFRDRITLLWLKRDRLAFKINQELALEDKKEFIFLVVFMPVELPLHNTEANYAVIDLAQGLVIPLLLAGGNQAGNIDELQKTKLGV
jgi:hypothetical protein